MMRRVFVLSIVLLTATVAISQSAVKNPATAIGCRQATQTLPQRGVAYRGAVTNDDYHFSARIPSDLTGWGGVADDAPFHGFTMFLDPKGDSCIVFEIHLRVDESDAPKRLPGGTAVQLGKAVGWQELKEGTANGVNIKNVRTVFSSKQSNQIDDGEIVLVSPTSNLKEAKRLYEAFLRSVRFGS